jgi:hypothetical protein
MFTRTSATSSNIMFEQVSIAQSTLDYLSAFNATDLRSIQQLNGSNDILVAVTATKYPIRLLSIIKADSGYQVKLIPEFDHFRDLKVTRLGKYPGGVAVLPQYPGKKVSIVTNVNKVEVIKRPSEPYMRSAEYIGKWLLVTSSSITLIDTSSKSNPPVPIANYKFLRIDKLADVSFELVDDVIVQIGQQKIDKKYVVILYRIETVNGTPQLKLKYEFKVSSQVLRVKPLNTNLTRILVSTVKGLVEYSNIYDPNQFIDEVIQIKTVDGHRIKTVNHILFEDNYLMMGTDCGVYYAKRSEDSQDINAFRCKDSPVAPVTALTLLKNDFLVAGFKSTKPNNRLISAWKVSR